MEGRPRETGVPRPPRGACRRGGPGALPPLLALFAGVALLAPSLSAQATAPVPLDDPLYRLLERVHARVPVPSVFHGQRPHTRAQVARWAREARAFVREPTSDTVPDVRADLRPTAPDPVDRKVLDGLLGAIEARVGSGGPDDGGEAGGDAPRLSTDRVTLGANLADTQARGVRATPLGRADGAIVNPLLGSRLGREAVDGLTLAMESEHRLRLHDRLIAFGGPRVAIHEPRHGDTDLDVLLRTGAVRGRVGAWALQLGRAELRRGQGRRAGVLRSDHPPPLDMVLVESETPFRLPWVLNALGPATYSAFLADLGADQNFPRATLFGSWVAVRPTRRLELGMGYLVHSGGEGSPEQDTWERVADHLLFVGRLFESPDSFQASNKVAGFEARLTLPGAVTWVEWYLDDARAQNLRRLGETLWSDAAHVVGLSLPDLAGAGALSGWLEFRHTGVRMYRHGQFTSGLSQEGFFVGDPLGPDALALGGGVDLWSERRGLLALEATWEVRSEDEWTAEGDFDRFVKSEDRPEEERWRVQLRWDRPPRGSELGWRVEAGVERVSTFDFDEGRDAWNGLLGVLLEWAPR